MQNQYPLRHIDMNLHFPCLMQVFSESNIYYTMIVKKSLNSNGQQFHQYQQNEQSPLALTR